MDFGIVFTSHVEQSWKHAVLAEQLGYSHAWFADSHMIYSDVYASMALAAEHTKTIKLATGVAVAGTRIAPVIAHSIATINRLAPGRVILGIGTGHTARRVMGMPAVSLREFRETLTVCRGLLHGEEVEYREGERKRQIRFLHLDKGYVDVTHPVPIHVAASHPKALEVVGELADGFTTFLYSPDPAQFSWTLDQVRKGAEKHGRVLQDFYTSAISMPCVMRQGETLDSSRVRALTGPYVMTMVHYLYEAVKRAEDIPPAYQEIFHAYQAHVEQMQTPADRRYQEVHDGHAIYTRPDEERFVTSRMIEESCLVGSREEIIRRIRAFAEAGLNQFIILPPWGHVEETMVEFAREIIAHY